MFNPWHSKPELIVHSAHPYNAEPLLHRFSAAMVTPQADFRASPDQSGSPVG